MAACERIQDDKTRGDCLITVALEGAPLHDEAPETVCEELPTGFWHDECIFLSAEYWRKERKPERAADLCALSGVWADNCAQHLWQTPVRSKVRKEETFADALPAMERLYCVWEPRVGDFSDLEHRFWERFYQMGLQKKARLELSACAGLEPDQRARCRVAGANLYEQRVHELVIDPFFGERYCSELVPPTVETMATLKPPLPNLLAQPDPLLDEVLAEVQHALCVEEELGHLSQRKADVAPFSCQPPK